MSKDTAIDKPAAPRSKRAKFYRLGALVALLVGLVIAGIASGVTDDLSVESFREAIVGFGPWGIVAYIGFFCVGLLVQVPGWIFIGAASLVWGKFLGAAIALLGGVIAVMFSFFLVRSVGGKLLTEIDKPWMKKILAKLDERPIRTMTILRMVVWVAPPLNYVLALSNVRPRDYFIAAVVGLTPAMFVLCYFFDEIARWIGWTS